jgi:hypothetical protein
MALFAGGALFSGYIYLFHIHGVFYSPLLVLVGVLLYLYRDGASTGWKTDLAAFAFAWVAAMFHPFAMLIFPAFYAGWFVERFRGLDGTRRAVAVTILAGCAAGILILGGSGPSRLAMRNVTGLLASYRTLEPHAAVSVVSLGFALITLLGTDSLSRRATGAWCAAAVLAGVWLVRADQAVLPVWIAACGLKTLVNRRWSLLCLAGMTAALPVVTGTGSPTYSVFVVMACTVCASYDRQAWEPRLAWMKWQAVVATSVACVAAVLWLRAGRPVPGLSRLVQPLLAEREKTYQLDAILEWFGGSDYRGYDVVLWRDAANPAADVSLATDRRIRPPTYQTFLDMYIAEMDDGDGSTSAGDGTLAIVFGGEEIPMARPVRTLTARFAGTARVYDVSRIAGPRSGS